MSRSTDIAAASTLPSSSPPSSSRPAVDISAVTVRDDFLLELGDTLTGQASVRPVETTAAALEHLASTKRGQVVVLDARDIADVRGDVELVHSRAPHAVVLVFAAAESERQVGTAVQGSRVLAVLGVPMDKRKAAAVLEGAIADATARKEAAVNPAVSNPAPSIEPFPASAPKSGPESAPEPASSPKSRLPLLAGVGLVALVLAAGAFWFLTRSPQQRAAPAQSAASTAAAPALMPSNNTGDDFIAPQPQADTSILSGKVDELLEKARSAMRERHYTEPAGDNALVYYRSAAAADPTNGEAKDGLQRVAGVLAARFEETLEGGRLEDAALTLANLKVAQPADPRAGSFEARLTTAQMSKAIAEGNFDRATALLRQAQQAAVVSAEQLNKWRTEIARRQEDSKIQRLVGLITDRVRDGKLTDPAEDSAQAYARELHDVAPSNAMAQRAIHDLNAVYLRKAREATLARNSADADRWIAAARSGGVSASELASFQRELASLRQKASQAETDRLVQLARDRIHDGRLTDPAQDSAAYYLGQAQGMDANSTALAQASHELADKLLERARAAALAGKPAEADVAQARHWGADPKDILAVQQTQPAAKPAPAQAQSRPASLAMLASGLKRVRYAAPEYPEKAATNKISGSVIVEYIVGTNGDPRDVHVVEATPPGVFDHAAITAVKRWHYDPPTYNGAPVEVPVRTSMRFELPK